MWVHCSPDPIWFPQSSPPAPSAASSRSCGWCPTRGGLAWAVGAVRRVGAGVEVVAAVPWRSFLIGKFLHCTRTTPHQDSLFFLNSDSLWIISPLCAKTSGDAGHLWVVYILSISCSKQNECPIKLGLKTTNLGGDHTQYDNTDVEADAVVWFGFLSWDVTEAKGGWAARRCSMFCFCSVSLMVFHLCSHILCDAKYSSKA